MEEVALQVPVASLWPLYFHPASPNMTCLLNLAKVDVLMVFTPESRLHWAQKEGLLNLGPLLVFSDFCPASPGDTRPPSAQPNGSPHEAKCQGQMYRAKTESFGAV